MEKKKKKKNRLEDNVFCMQGDFREENFNTAMSVLREAGDAAKGDQRGRKGGGKGKTNLSLAACLAASFAGKILNTLCYKSVY